MMAFETPNSDAGPSTYTPGPTPYHETSQYLHWRYSRDQLSTIRADLNAKSVEVASRNTRLEETAQRELGNDFKPSPPADYLTVEDELLLLRFYISQVSTICRKGFGLPEVVESTAISYMKRFYLKNGVMDWHPKNIMPTCLFLAAKTTNHPVPLDVFLTKFKPPPSNILETEFLLAQSLSFEFWTRGAEKALRGWSLEFQIQLFLPSAAEYLTTSRLTDVEFLYTPSQISLACWRLATPDLVKNYLDYKYPDANHDPHEGLAEGLPFGLARDKLETLLNEVEETIKQGEGPIDVKLVKRVDKRLKGSSNPEKIPGTALYLKRKKELEQSASDAKMEKEKVNKLGADDIFGEVLRKPLSPRVTIQSPSKRQKME